MIEMKNLEKIRTVDKLKEMSKNYYETFSSAREKGQYIGYVTAVYPVEILRAMDILPYYPENYAVICSVRNLTEDLSRVAEAKGYAKDLCTYARCGLGSLFYENSIPVGDMPSPDFLLPCNTQCGTLTKWFEAMGKIFHAPVILLDAPFVRETTPSPHCLDYFISQIKELISFLEVRTKKKLDIDRLREVLSYSAEACSLWNEALDLARYQPAPWSAFDEYIHMAAIVTHRGTEECVNYYKDLKDFLLERVAAKFAAVPGERYRFYWDNIPMWFRLRKQYELLSSYGIVLLASLYIHSWAYSFDANDPFRSLAENYLTVFSNRDIGKRASLTIELMHRYQLNGYIFHSNRSCKGASLGIYDVMKLISQQTGIRGMVFEADMGDPHFFSEEQFKVKLETYLNVLDSATDARSKYEMAGRMEK